MRMDQLAMYANTDEQMQQIKDWFGIGGPENKWVTDTVTCVSDVYTLSVSTPNKHQQIENVAELNFNYDLGIEFEILRFIKGPSWHWMIDAPQPANRKPFMSHMGIHLEHGEPWPWERDERLLSMAIEGHGRPAVGTMIANTGRLVQRTKTTAHTSKMFTNPDSPAYGRRYEYEIYQIGSGAFAKYIRRIHPHAKPAAF